MSEVVHVEESERKHQFELGVDLNRLMHTQQFFTKEKRIVEYTMFSNTPSGEQCELEHH